MKKIRNPNQIVDSFVSDCQESFGERLVSVIMYGPAVTHEYIPGKSAVKLAIVLTDTKLSTIAASASMHKKWNKWGIETPIFITPEWLQSSLDTLPVEYLDLQANYRVVFGVDVVDGVTLSPVHIRLLCERELRKCALSLRQHYVLQAGEGKAIQKVLYDLITELEPVFKALVVLKDRKIPYSRSDIVAQVEDLYGLGPSVLSEILFSKNARLKNRYEQLYFEFSDAIDSLVEKVDSLGGIGV
ncbi:MAG: hypothetical protein ACOC4C_03960 [Fibrobacterota bacterium]